MLSVLREHEDVPRFLMLTEYREHGTRSITDLIQSSQRFLEAQG